VTRVERVLDQAELVAGERCEPLVLDHLPLEGAPDEPARGRLARDDGDALPGVVHHGEGHDLDRGVDRSRLGLDLLELALVEVPAGRVFAVLLPPGLALHACLGDDEHVDVLPVGECEHGLDRVGVEGGIGVVAQVPEELLADPAGPVLDEDEAVAGVGDVAHVAQLGAGDGVRLERFDHLPLPEGRDDLFPGILAGTRLRLPRDEEGEHGDERQEEETGHAENLLLGFERQKNLRKQRFCQGMCIEAIDKTVVF